MFTVAWLVLLGGFIVATVVLNQNCGTWGLSCLVYAFFIALGSASTSAVMFWAQVGTSPRGTTRRYLVLTMACLTTAVALAGIAIVLAT